jgi:hypothetical protein
MGFRHTDSDGDVVFRNALNCDALPSARERYHTMIAYSRPLGNQDPDEDTSTATILSLPRVTAY